MQARLTLGAVAIAWGVVLATAAYASIHGMEVLFGPSTDPAATAWSEHAPYFWRIGTVSYLGGLIAFVVAVAARRRLGWTVRGLHAAVAVAAAMITLQGLLLP